MSEAPERIWIDKTYGRHPEDWDFTDGRYLTKAQLRKKVEYIRADRIEELEAKLAKVITAYRIEAMRRDDYSHAAFQQHLAELIRGQKDA